LFVQAPAAAWEGQAAAVPSARHSSLGEPLGPDPWLLDRKGRRMFNVELSVGDFDGHAVVALCGELDLFDSPDVASHLIAAVAAYGPNVIVDLTGLNFVDSCGLGVLVRVLRWTRANGGDLSLAAPQQLVRRVLEIAGLIDIFSVYPSLDQAMSAAALAHPRPASVF
jgi:anti-sigma B factor antagonist